MWSFFYVNIPKALLVPESGSALTGSTHADRHILILDKSASSSQDESSCPWARIARKSPLRGLHLLVAFAEFLHAIAKAHTHTHNFFPSSIHRRRSPLLIRLDHQVNQHFHTSLHLSLSLVTWELSMFSYLAGSLPSSLPGG